MARLPNVGDDLNAWGSVMNDYLLVGHTSGGMHTNAIDVKEHGAVGDGVADDAPAIQAAIDASAPGDTILFSAGTYKLGAMLQLRAGRAYVGAVGAEGGGAVLILANGVNPPAVLASYEWANNQTFAGLSVTLNGLIIDANKANNTTAHGLVLQNWGVRVEDCEFRNIPGDGIFLTDQTMTGTNITNTDGENLILNCHFRGITGNGVHAADYTHNTLSDGFIQNCLFDTIGGYGIYLERAAGWLVAGNHLYSLQQNGIVALNCWMTRIVHNYVETWGESNVSDTFHAIFARAIAQGVIIANNTISCSEPAVSPWYEYIAVQANDPGGETRILIAGNLLYGNFSNTSQGHGAAGSVGIAITSGTDQQTGGHPAHVLAYGNQMANIGTDHTKDTYTTMDTFPVLA